MSREANISQPSITQLGGPDGDGWVQIPFYPTSPFIPTNPFVSKRVRYYGQTLSATDLDYTVNSESSRIVQFDLSRVLVAINGAAVNLNALGSSVGALSTINMNLTYLFRLEYTTGDKLHTAPRLANTVVGTQENPGELGADGFMIDQGASVQLGITPLLPNLRIDITLVCMELRGLRNTSPARSR